ncbi:MAG: FadR family transcriptional regulator [Planctomycetota bacterium]|nr:MAG: FadR family transcriptional regulator [Planctomycetota bacterium]
MADNREISIFQAVSHRRLTEDIADQIERLILNEELKVGDILPPERELAAQMQVSRNILREAIKVLTQKGLLEVRPGSGTYVARPTVEFLQDTLDFFFRFSSSALFDLIQTRRLLEVEIAGLAAQRATAEDCQLIETRLNEMEAVIDNPDAYIEADIHFHEALATVADNGILRLLLNSIRGALRRNITILVRYHPSAVETAMQYHRRIVQAVQQHNIEAACLAMREHVEDVGRGLRDLEAQGITLSQD